MAMFNKKKKKIFHSFFISMETGGSVQGRRKDCTIISAHQKTSSKQTI